MTTYDYTIIDRCEGTIRGTVEATSEDAASDEVDIIAAENGCRCVQETIIEEL